MTVPTCTSTTLQQVTGREASSDMAVQFPGQMAPVATCTLRGQVASMRPPTSTLATEMPGVCSVRLSTTRPSPGSARTFAHRERTGRSQTSLAGTFRRRSFDL